jgi:transcriptional regulator with XRE-family HTH domain
VISKLIKLVMKECGLTQTHVAEVIGCSLSRVKAITSGRVQKLTREESEALVKKLHIRAEWLVTGEGPMFQTPAERDFQRRIDTVSHATARAIEAGLSDGQARLLQSLMLAAETGDSVTLSRLLVDLAPDEAALLDNYRNSPPAGRDALKATSAALAKQSNTNQQNINQTLSAPAAQVAAGNVVNQQMGEVHVEHRAGGKRKR